MASLTEDDAKASTTLMEIAPSAENQPPRKQEVKQASGLAGAAQFLREVAIEHRKITWPDRKQILRETWSVIVLVAAITLMVLGIDWILGHAVFGPIEHFAKLSGAVSGRE